MDTVTLITNASYVIACENGKHYIVSGGEVAYRGNTIVFVGKKYPMDADVKIDAKKAIVSPGLLNLHCHLQGSEFEKSFIEDTGNPCHFMSGLYSFLGALRPPEEYRKTSLQFALAELMTKGTTTVFEQGDGYDDIVETLGASGLRVVYGPGTATTRFTTRDGRSVHYEDRGQDKGFAGLEKMLELRKKYDGAYDGRVTIAMNLWQADTCCRELLEEAARQLRLDEDMICCIHAAQSINEYIYIAQTYGATPADFLHSHGIYGPRVHYGHYLMPRGHHMNAMMMGDELGTIAKDGTNVIHCPWSFGRRGFILESFQKYRDMGINMGIGTDTVALDMLMEMRWAAIFCKAAERSNPLTGKASDIFNAATIGGANALRRSDLGRIEPGCKADIILIDIKNLDCTPMRDPIKTIVFTATGRNVSRVIVDGIEIADESGSKTLDTEKLVWEMQAAQDTLMGRFAENHWGGKSHLDVSPMSFPVRYE
jgi:cytosine/adenosine deaminase-related metal-dependent hydrolase